MAATAGWDDGQPWYHGSQQQIPVLRAGSSITQIEAVARAFSHRPSTVSLSSDSGIKHNGTTPGYLYVVAENLGPDDIYLHPHPVNVSRWEWLTRRELRVQLIEQTQVRDADRLTAADLAELEPGRWRQGC